MSGDELKAWMQVNDYSVRELAHDLAVHWTAVYQWMAGVMRLTEINVRALQALAADSAARERRVAARMTVGALREWLPTHAYAVEDLADALDMAPRAVEKLLARHMDEELPRPLVLAVRSLECSPRPIRPVGMDGAEFAAWLGASGQTQRDVADALGVSIGAVSRWNAGTRGVSPMVRLALRTLG